jgi:hypothetical protein
MLGRLACSGLVLAAILAAATSSAPARDDSRETFTGVIVPIGTIGVRGTMQFTVYVDRYATDEERQMMAKALISEGQQGLLKVLRKMKMGTIQVGPRVGYPIRAAISLQTEKGRRIRLVTDRPITIPEIYAGSRSKDYQFGLVEFDLAGKDEGTGTIIFAAEVNVLKDGTIEVEAYGANPAKLMGVQQR